MEFDPARRVLEALEQERVDAAELQRRFGLKEE